MKKLFVGPWKYNVVVGRGGSEWSIFPILFKRAVRDAFQNGGEPMLMGIFEATFTSEKILDGLLGLMVEGKGRGRWKFSFAEYSAVIYVIQSSSIDGKKY